MGHGHARRGRRTREYRAWVAMRTRCLNPKSQFYARYGGRGIRICAQWMASFPAFFRDVGPAPSDAHSLDRIDNERGYEPGNVRWATALEQRKNNSHVRRITFNGETLHLKEWALRLGICQASLRERLARGWPLDRALTLGRTK